MIDVLPERGLIGAGTREYRERRAELLRAETDLRARTEEVARMRRELPPGPVMPSYRLVEGPADLSVDVGLPVPVDVPDLLSPAHDTLVLYHLMFWPQGGCPMCSMWLDGLNGVAAHLAQHLSFAVTAPAPLDRLREWGRARGWHRLRLVSAAGTTLGRDLGVADADGGQMPGVSVLTRAGQGRVRLFWHGRPGLVDGASGQGLRGRGIDSLSPVWNLFDLTPGGRPDWWPDNDYPLGPVTW